MSQALSFYEKFDRKKGFPLTNPLFVEWCSKVAEGKSERFQKRFEWEEQSKITFAPWQEELQKLLTFLKKSKPLPASFFDKKNPRPFEEILSCFVSYARKDFEEHRFKDLHKDVWRDLERHLLFRLSHLFAFTLQEEFILFKHLQGGLPFAFENDNKKRSRGFYKAFVETFDGMRWQAFFDEYPLLARLTVYLITFWKKNSLEFVWRLHDDIDSIKTHFNEGKAIGKLRKIDTSCSDFHLEGKSVFILTFQKGLKLVYKPRDISIEKAYFDFLDWIQTKENSFSFKIVKTLPREGYGWVEFVLHAPCQSEEELKKYYERAGALLASITLLRGTDCHFENTIASGAFPVVVDLETLMQPEVVLDEENEMKKSFLQMLCQSPLVTMLLPYSSYLKGAFESSGFAGEMKNEKREVFHWQAINQDTMCFALSEKKRKKREFFHLPELHGEAIFPKEYIDEMKLGYARLFRFVMNHSSEIIDGILNRFQSVEARLVIRNTALYGSLLEESLKAPLMRNGLQRSISLDLLSRLFLFYSERSPLFSILQEEHKALFQLDIPKFLFRADSYFLHAPLTGENLEKIIVKSGYDCVRKLIQTLNEELLKEHLHLISYSLDVRFLDQKKKNEKRMSPPPSPLSKALIVAQDVERQLYLYDDFATLLQPSLVSEDVFELKAAENNLYEGAIGIALFFSALYSETKDEKYKKSATLLINPLCKIIEKDLVEKLVLVEGIGGASGLGSYIFGFSKLAQFLNDKSYSEKALKLVDYLTEKEIRKDQKFDVIAGSSGTILSLLSLYRQLPEKKIIEKAILCAEHLLNSSIEVKKNQRAWINPVISKKPQIGFAHGGSGIATALSQLFFYTKDERLLQVALEAFNFEDRFFCEERKNWPDLRESLKKSIFPFGWCYGASGCGLARLQAFKFLDARAKEKTEKAIESVMNAKEGEKDGLCCGNLGQIEFLLKASHVLLNDEYKKCAEEKAQKMLLKKEWVSFRGLEKYHVGLFQGLSGFGYSMLRLHYPEKYPSLLLWE